jgi:hypothetical protein
VSIWIKVTAADLARAERVSRDPLASDGSVSIDPTPVAGDDGLCFHAGEYVPCAACQWDPVHGLTLHLHCVITGSNGGVRCVPIGIGTVSA